MLSVWGLFQEGLPSAGQAFQSLLVALFSGVAATLLFFKATDLVKNNHCRLAVIESTQSGEVLFTLLGGIWFLRDPSPDSMGFLGIFLIISGMIWNSCQSGISRKKE
jgi:drug/metabolite transporter (DMT)-like permease